MNEQVSDEGDRMTKFLFKANNEVISHCKCENEPAMSTGQLDCPWCGCGWLIACSSCAKSFTFAEIRETEYSMEELGRREVNRRGLKNITDEEIRDWAADMAVTLEPFSVGDVVVYLDGSYWKIDQKNVKFDGYFASHEFSRLPHAQALGDVTYLRRTLGTMNYWTDRELADRE